MPLKPVGVAKSRLRGAMPGVAHADLVRALATATATAALSSAAVGRLVLVTNEDLPGFEKLPDRHGSLNAAVREAAAQIEGAVAVLPADLPALRPEELTQALRQATTRSFVPDADGTGTVVLATPAGALLPRFGPGSALAHEQSGARRLAGPWPTLRRDVDTAADLDEALRLGWLPAHPGVQRATSL